MSERLNFVLTNRLPRHWITSLIGWLSRCRHPLVVQLSIRMLQFFAGDLRLEESPQRRFTTLEDCFTRELLPGARPIDADPDTLVSPCDGELMAAAGLQGERLIQAKGLSYTLAELIGDADRASCYAEGVFATLRLRANMYHRFHAPDAGCIDEILHIRGDTWNVNPPAVKAVDRLYCRNTRAVLPLRSSHAVAPVLVVPVAALGVASLRLHALDRHLERGETGRRRFPCQQRVARGDELGYFRQGSTVIVVAPPGFALASGAKLGATLRMGWPLLRRHARNNA